MMASRFVANGGKNTLAELADQTVSVGAEGRGGGRGGGGGGWFELVYLS